MKVLHAFWRPDSAVYFEQVGEFHLWVETAATVAKPAAGQHPRHLLTAKLHGLLAELGVADNGKRVELPLRLPSHGDAPLPCPELAPFCDIDWPAQAEPQDWKTTCWQLEKHPIASLSELHFQALFQGQELRVGGDFLFWHWFCQSLKAVMCKDAYVPALRLEASPKKGGLTAHTGWDFAAEAYERLIREAVPRMPDSAAMGYEAESLLRHCAEVLLHRSLRSADLTQAAQKKIDGSLVDDALRHGIFRLRADAADGLDLYRSWQDWRRKLAGGTRGLRFQLGLRLREASAHAPDVWGLAFEVSARDDPSLVLALEDYWELDGKARQAAGQPFGADFEQNLLLQLGQAARIFPALWEGLETDQPIGIELDLADAFGFLHETAWVLEDAGFRVAVPAWWTPQGRRRAKLKMRNAEAKKTIASSSDSGLSLAGLLQYQYELTLGGETVNPQEWEQLVAAKTPLVQFRGQWVALDREQMREMLAFWQKQGEAGETLDVRELLRRQAEDAEWFEIDAEDAWAEMLAKLRDPRQIAAVADPPKLNASLREYQKRGVGWLAFMAQLGLGGCLADDMGLGKTMQVIAQWVLEKEQGDGLPNLLIAPTSVIGNWRREIERFAPHLTTHIHHGTARAATAEAVAERCQGLDVFITSYALARKDVKLLAARRWRRVVLDEAQNIKNPLAAQTKAILQLPSDLRLALTGTPVENRLLDLWSIFNFLNPGYLGKQAQFRKNYELP
ncbi:MAG: DEAD/DEAH box helicase, partial [Candidatus Methylumidiphilus sp.]